MKLRILMLICSSIFLYACVQAPVFKGDGFASIRSNYPVVKVNGNEVEPLYKLDIEAGKITAVIVYNTYRHDYYCTFSWNAEASTVYEVTDQGNQYPLTLYRWVRTNSLWASRLDPVDPIECAQEPRKKKTAE